MYLSHIQIDNFRNISSCYLDLSEGLNLFCGDNAQGKTNLLEAVFYLVTGRSFRARSDRDCLPWNVPREQVTAIRGQVVRSAGTLDLLVAFTSAEKKILINEKSIDRLGLLWGNINAVLFTPNDLLLIKGAPMQRRKMMDVEFSQINNSYLRYLQRFNEALKQRNALLRADTPRASALKMLEAWDEQLADAAVEIFALRSRYLSEIEKYAQKCYSYITNEKESLEIKYENFLSIKKHPLPDSKTLKDSYLALLEDKRDEDFYRSQTNDGPHKDDWVCYINGYEAKNFASQGQQRSVVLAIRLAEIEMMKNTVGETPLLLLDDIISEIDEKRQQRFFEYINQPIQTIITSTSSEQVISRAAVKNIYKIQSGNFAAD